MLKRWFFVAGFVVLAGVLAWWALPGPAGKVTVGEVAPDFSLPDLHGVQRHLPKGKVVLLNFWATWCPPCRKEIPSMVDLDEKLKDKGLAVIGASVDKDGDQLTGFVREYGVPFEVLRDADSTVSRRYGVFRYPETFLIDRKGVVRYHLVGAVEWTNPAVINTIDKLLAEK